MTGWTWVGWFSPWVRCFASWKPPINWWTTYHLWTSVMLGSFVMPGGGVGGVGVMSVGGGGVGLIVWCHLSASHDPCVQSIHQPRWRDLWPPPSTSTPSPPLVPSSPSHSSPRCHPCVHASTSPVGGTVTPSAQSASEWHHQRVFGRCLGSSPSCARLHDWLSHRPTTARFGRSVRRGWLIPAITYPIVVPRLPAASESPGPASTRIPPEIGVSPSTSNQSSDPRGLWCPNVPFRPWVWGPSTQPSNWMWRSVAARIASRCCSTPTTRTGPSTSAWPPPCSYQWPASTHSHCESPIGMQAVSNCPPLPTPSLQWTSVRQQPSTGVMSYVSISSPRTVNALLCSSWESWLAHSWSSTSLVDSRISSSLTCNPRNPVTSWLSWDPSHDQWVSSQTNWIISHASWIQNLRFEDQLPWIATAAPRPQDRCRNWSSMQSNLAIDAY